jgi:AraC-like DNA-binding protein
MPMRIFTVSRPVHDDLSTLPFPTFLLRPPYDRPERVVQPNQLPAQQVKPGTVMLLEVDPAERNAVSDLETWIPALRHRFVSTPLALWVPGDSPAGDVARLARRSVRLGVRAVVSKEEPLGPTLRGMLTTPPHLDADAVEWFWLRGLNFTPDIAYMVQGIFLLAPTHRTLSDLLSALHIPASSMGAKLSKKILPPASNWLHLAHAMYSALRLQSSPDTSVCRVALEFGYGDHSALSRQLIRNFGLRPSAIRETLGWEWLLDRWVERSLVGHHPRLQLAGAA